MVYLENSNFNNMEEGILNIKNLSKSFDGLKLFEATGIKVQRSTINVLFGSNGSGKTTFFNIISGYEKPDSGEIYFEGLKISNRNEFEIARAGIGKMWQDPTIFPNHTVLQNLVVSDKTHPGDYFQNYFFKRNTIQKKEKELKDRANDILKRLKLGNKSDDLAGNLSIGERKLLSICMLLMNKAQLLLLDEPFSSINPDTIERISEILNDLRNEGKTILMIEHKVKFARKISDNTFNIENYKIQQLN